MRKITGIISLFTFLLLCTPPVLAKPMGSFNFNGKSYYLELWSGNLTARGEEISVNGEKKKELGNFSQWVFKPQGEPHFAIIINGGSGKIINVKEIKTTSSSGQETGPYIAAADGKFIVLEYDSDTVMKPFSLMDETGNIIFKDEYIDGIKFNKNNDKVIFVYNSASPLRNLEEMTKCHDQDKGIAIKIDTRYYDTEAKKLARIVPHGREFRCLKN